MAVSLGCRSAQAWSPESRGYRHETDRGPAQRGGTDPSPGASDPGLQPGFHTTHLTSRSPRIGLTPPLGSQLPLVGAANEDSPQGSLSPTACWLYIFTTTSPACRVPDSGLPTQLHSSGL